MPYPFLMTTRAVQDEKTAQDEAALLDFMDETMLPVEYDFPTDFLFSSDGMGEEEQG